jgi:class 3 adenylate cyclase
MEPQIQYAKTSDGVKIAYWALGEGPPLVVTAPMLFSNIALEWEVPELRSWYERLASRRRLVRFDWRNQGLSQRGVSTSEMTFDLPAVAEHCDLRLFDLVAFFGPGMIAIPYAADHPERISRLLLWSVSVHGRDDFPDTERTRALRTLVRSDWGMAVETFAHASLGWGTGGVAHDWARFMRSSISQGDMDKAFEVVPQSDVTEYLDRITAQTLVLYQVHRRQRALQYRAAHSREAAARIPNARLVQIADDPVTPYLHEDALRIVEEFLDIRERPPEARPPEAPSGTAVILFADIVDSTALTERLGDAAFRTKARDLDAALRTVIREHAGTPIEGKLLGDGVLAVFTSARQAIEAARACATAGNHAALPLHLGLHAGDVIREDNNVYGGAVNIAARISGLSAPGELLVSDTVRSLARTSAGVSFEDRGEQTLKGVGEPVRVWAVREGDAG